MAEFALALAIFAAVFAASLFSMIGLGWIVPLAVFLLAVALPPLRWRARRSGEEEPELRWFLLHLPFVLWGTLIAIGFSAPV